MKHNRTIIYLAGFLFALPIALSSYINSSFIASFIGEKSVGLIYTIGSITSVLALLVAPKIFKKIGGYRFLLLIIFLNIISFIVLATTQNVLSAIAMFILGFSMNTLIVFSLDEILKIVSTDKETGQIRGMYLALSSSAWVFAQVASGLFLGNFSFQTIYLISFFLTLILLILSFFKLKYIPQPNYDNENIFKYLSTYFANKNLRRAYFISFLLHLFFCWMVIYTPIYLYSHLGFSWREIGVIFAFMLLPFSLIPFHLGKHADKFGERKTLMSGFFIISLSTISIFFIEQHSVIIWAIVLFSTRVGASIIEVMIDTYFFKHIKPENDQFIGVFRTVTPVAYIIGPLFASFILIFLPSFNFLYVVLGSIMLIGIYLSSTIKKSDV